MIFIIVDLEATCWEDRSHKPNEIIEIGAVCIGEEGEHLGEFNLFVKPVIHPVLSPFCIQLTSITQKMVDGAFSFPKVLQQFQEWIHSFQDSYTLCSWGFYDKVQFKDDCELHQLDTNWIKPHISLKHQYAEIRNLRKPIGMKEALRREGLSLQGTHHRGIDDARNIAKIFVLYLDFWKYD